MESGGKSWVRFLVYVHYKREVANPYSTLKRRLLQAMLVVSDVVFWWVPMIAFGSKIYWSYYVSHKSKMLKNICYTKSETKGERHFLDVYPALGDESRSRPVVVFIHGGAWGFNGKEDHHMVGKFLQSKGFAVVVANYSRYPFGHVEDMVVDLDDVFDWTFQHIEEHGGDPDRVILVGHSAGAHLVALTLLEKIRQKSGQTLLLEREPRLTDWPRKISRVLLLSGVFDIHEHYKYESWRAVEDISPMKPAMRGLEYFPQYSPTTILHHSKSIDGT
eukprot:TRINITY_DN2846_c0_g1_i4.p1 TRINITY_DN2846_c0_g1~~TRINITY_DN2846_c0_g1_i4.p1  ORF type:complete len:287 (-),score=41.44 TRINITY_DN2846_c0_g1_i4:329-1153(-)